MLQEHAQLHQQMGQILAAEVNNAQALRVSLDEECQCLTGNHHPELENASRAKLELARDIDRLANERDWILGQHGLPPGREGMAQLLRTIAEDDPIADLWRDLHALARQCRSANHALGSLLRRRKAAGEQALHILRRSTLESLQLYDTRGHTGDGSATRSLGRV